MVLNKYYRDIAHVSLDIIKLMENVSFREGLLLIVITSVLHALQQAFVTHVSTLIVEIYKMDVTV